ncbi:putative toxin-antitoxin system toxin component, PIN family [Sphaerospermopsis sp. FACHB-1094]|uniref:PilT protein domain protein n=1 Tax=Sphaerospermopsis reniformis TaxID=531300 RepID=A0A480A6D6_9CYAN|nr:MULTISPECIES: putative toxin-antitoxin system toxin component, PIN family [Sphaerospermopsis]MBD2135092.1 putative toxin-antitoxin system toxin component, PIN family [Sphaerospermopsis sp. FACHB-1094]GCL39446.1 PilT protein domain protein [Sphaerospermopsis reniformis]
MTRPYQIVIDTNVILAGLRSNRGASYKLLTILNDTRWQLNISTALIFEYEEILKREKDQLNLKNEDIDNVIEAICAISNQCNIFYLWRPVARDPDDDFVIDLAVECQADFIITYNQKDLQAAEKFGIRVLTPKQFLQQVGELS